MPCAPMIPRGLARGGEQLRHVVRIGGRRQARQALGAHRRQREAFDGLDDPIEFEGPQGAWLHRGTGYYRSGIGLRLG